MALPFDVRELADAVRGGSGLQLAAGGGKVFDPLRRRLFGLGVKEVEPRPNLEEAPTTNLPALYNLSSPNLSDVVRGQELPSALPKVSDPREGLFNMSRRELMQKGRQLMELYSASKLLRKLPMSEEVPAPVEVPTVEEAQDNWVPNLRMYPRPGKYEAELAIAEPVHGLGPGVETVDLGDGEGYVDIYDLIPGPFDAKELARMRVDTKEGDVELNEDEKRFLKDLAGVIVHEDNQGFVSVEWFTSKEKDKLEETWAGLQKDEEDLNNQQEDEYR